jgi:hypothetical protein
MVPKLITLDGALSERSDNSGGGGSWSSKCGREDGCHASNLESRDARHCTITQLEGMKNSDAISVGQLCKCW